MFEDTVFGDERWSQKFAAVTQKSRILFNGASGKLYRGLMQTTLKSKDIGNSRKTTDWLDCKVTIIVRLRMPERLPPRRE